MARLEAAFESLFGSRTDAFADMPPLVPDTSPGAEGKGKDKGENAEAGEPEVIKVYRPHNIVSQQQFDEALALEKRMYNDALEDEGDRLLYLFGRWSETPSDPAFANTRAYLERAHGREGRWLREKGTRSIAVHRPEGRPFQPEHIHVLKAQSASVIAGGIFPDQSTVTLTSNAREATEATLEEHATQRALVEDCLCALSPSQFRDYESLARAEFTQLSENERHLKGSSGMDRLRDLETKIAILNHIKTSDIVASRWVPPMEAVTEVDEEAAALAEPEVRTEDAVLQPLHSAQYTCTTMVGVVLDSGSALHPAKQMTKAAREIPVAPAGTAAPPLRFTCPHDAAQHVGEGAVVTHHGVQEMHAKTAQCLSRLAEQLYRKEGDYARSRPFTQLAGKLLLADARHQAVTNEDKAEEGKGKEKRETALPRYDPTKPPAWHQTPFGIPLTTRNCHIAIDEPLAPGAAGTRLYVVQNGVLACYDLARVKDVGGCRPDPIWSMRGLPHVAQLAVSQGWIALATVGNVVHVLRVAPDSHKAFGAQFRAPLLSSLMWRASEGPVDEQGHDLWIGETTGHIMQLHIAAPAPATGAEAEGEGESSLALRVSYGCTLWTGYACPVRKTVVRGQHTVTMNDYAAISQSVHHAFGGGLPFRSVLMHSPADVAFSNGVLALMRSDGTVYLFNMERGKLDTTMEQLSQDLKRRKWLPADTRTPLLYFNGDFLRAYVPQFSLLQATIHPGKGAASG